MVQGGPHDAYTKVSEKKRWLELKTLKTSYASSLLNSSENVNSLMAFFFKIPQ